MALALIYMFATAKPISMRRLSALFILALMLAITALSTLRVQNVQAYALLIATSLTLLVWSIPPLQVLRDSMRCGSLRLDALESVSATVQWSYALTIAATPFAILLINGAPRYLQLAGFARVLVIVGILAFLLQLGVLITRRSGFKQRTLPRTAVRGHCIKESGERLSANEDGQKRF
jgi:hypothetical protein